MSKASRHGRCHDQGSGLLTLASAVVVAKYLKDAGAQVELVCPPGTQVCPLQAETFMMPAQVGTFVGVSSSEGGNP